MSGQKKKPVTLKVTIPPDKPEEWVSGYVSGYAAGYREGVTWARDAAVKIIKGEKP